jgi:hypothetical protein
MSRGVEQIATVRRIDVKEDTRDDDSLFLEQFFEEGLKDHQATINHRFYE